MRKLKQMLERIIPRRLLSLYHLSLAYLGAVLYGLPSRKILVIGVTGTKGKSSTVEMLNAIFEEAGRLQANQQIRGLARPTPIMSAKNSSRSGSDLPIFLQRAIPHRSWLNSTPRTSNLSDCLDCIRISSHRDNASYFFL